MMYILKKPIGEILARGKIEEKLNLGVKRLVPPP
jgi:hypothetical protein